jgi:hypothetical protein
MVTGMANRHFGKVADVWKHLPLVEILAVDQPTKYGETHAGSAGYRLVDDSERRFGVMRFLNASAESPQLAECRYRAHLDDLVSGDGDMVVCPGSPLLAMRELGRSARYVCCDLDADSVADINRWAARLGLGDRVDAVAADGMATIATQFLGANAMSQALVHIDPYDPFARQPGAPSALDLAAQLASAGVKVVYWYGYDTPTDRGWAVAWLRRAATGVSWWCSDMLVTTADGATAIDGHLGSATTPGTGFGIVAAHISETARCRCERLGDALADAYAGATLPDGTPGGLDHRFAQ